jgi:metal-dependent HD superfamily phosphatase/phosphodiesterase
LYFRSTQQRKQLKHIKQQSNSTIVVAEEEGKLVSYLVAIGGSVKRTKHSAYLVIFLTLTGIDRSITEINNNYIFTAEKSTANFNTDFLSSQKKPAKKRF